MDLKEAIYTRPPCAISRRAGCRKGHSRPHRGGHSGAQRRPVGLMSHHFSEILNDTKFDIFYHAPALILISTVADVPGRSKIARSPQRI
jgi:hypothetical protein